MFKIQFALQVMVNLSGPEEMKWPSKRLYTYNVQEGDRFIVDEKVQLGRLRTNRGSSNSLYDSTSPKVYGSSGRTAIQFGMSPRNGFGPFKMSPMGPGGVSPNNQKQQQSNSMPRGAASASRNLFGRTPPSSGPGSQPGGNSPNPDQS